jgi:hypothetical protein
MNRRKEIINEYKERNSRGGVYTITNTLNGKYLIGHAANLKSVQNRFQFAVTTVRFYGNYGTRAYSYRGSSLTPEAALR